MECFSDGAVPARILQLRCRSMECCRDMQILEKNFHGCALGGIRSPYNDGMRINLYINQRDTGKKRDIL